ncbi:MAG: KTSC domain-containing protein [Hyphomicrobiales bacterium]|nr:KTSC domain-containing protein [Hyphomicrobiales bacterium]
MADVLPMLTLVLIVGLFLWWAFRPAPAEIVDVKYRGPLDLAKFDCAPVTRSSFINRVCHNRDKQEMVIQLSGTYYVYCGIPQGVVEDMLAAESMGRHFNAQIRSRYACAAR